MRASPSSSLLTTLSLQPVKAWSWIVKEELQRDFAIVQLPGDSITVAHLRGALRSRDACRWVLFVLFMNDARREERIVARSSIAMPDDDDDGGGGFAPDQRRIAVSRLPVDSDSFLRGAMKPVADESLWWSEPPRTTESMDAYAQAATAFLHDLRSERPLSTVNRPGLWITLRAVAAVGCAAAAAAVAAFIVCVSDEILLGQMLDRFHSALLYDLRQGAHRFSAVLTGALSAIPEPPAGVIASINIERPMVTAALRSMFPTDNFFGALSLGEIGIVLPLVASRALFIQAGWLMAPLRLLRPYVLAAKTTALLRTASRSWLVAANASTPGNGADRPEIRNLGMEARRLFREQYLSDVQLKAHNAMNTSSANGGGGVKPRPPPCAREYLVRAERGDLEAKLPYNIRWGMVRMLRAVGFSRFEVERAFISAKGMPVWYPNPSDRAGMVRERTATLNSAFRKHVYNGGHSACSTFARYGACPLQGDVSACCLKQSNGVDAGAGAWTPVHVATRPHIEVAIEFPPTEALLGNLYVVRDPPARLHFAAATRL